MPPAISSSSIRRPIPLVANTLFLRRPLRVFFRADSRSSFLREAVGRDGADHSRGPGPGFAVIASGSMPRRRRIAGRPMPPALVAGPGVAGVLHRAGTTGARFHGGRSSGWSRMLGARSRPSWRRAGPAARGWVWMGLNGAGRWCRALRLPDLRPALPCRPADVGLLMLLEAVFRPAAGLGWVAGRGIPAPRTLWRRRDRAGRAGGEQTSGRCAAAAAGRAHPRPGPGLFQPLALHEMCAGCLRGALTVGRPAHATRSWRGFGRKITVVAVDPYPGLRTRRHRPRGWNWVA